jgi:hypothetical protein
MKKKMGSSKSVKKMQYGGNPTAQPAFGSTTPNSPRQQAKIEQVKAQVPVSKGASSAPIIGVRKAIFNQAKNDWGETPETQWSYDQMQNWKNGINKAPYKKGGSIGKMKKGGSVGSSKKPKMAKGGSVSFGMLSVKKGIDKNPKPTAADRIAGAKMKKGGSVKKSSKKK